MVDLERIKIGKKQTIDTLIAEEALLFPKYLREEKKIYGPRTVNLYYINHPKRNRKMI